MSLEEIIKSGRSIRKYKNDMPGSAEISAILEAGRWAPSGLNNQPWKFKIVKGEKKEGLSAFTKYGHVINSAPVVICVFLDLEASYSRDKDILAVGACIQNMLLKAWEMGIGTCWLGEILNRKKEAAKYLHIEGDVELMAVITAGYFTNKTNSGKRKKLDSFVL